MRFSGAFIPTQRDVPRDAVVASHQLMLRAGMISQESAGIYTWLPFGLRALQRIETLICQEQERAGAARSAYANIAIGRFVDGVGTL